MSRATGLLLVISLSLLATSATGQISGYLWEDLDGNGVPDAGEPPLVGVTVRVMGAAASGAPSAYGSTVTDALGYYEFTTLPATGNYLIDATGLPADVRGAPPRSDAPDADGDGEADQLNKAAWLPFGPFQRWNETDFLYDRLLAGGVQMTTIGDSITEGKSYCVFTDTDYVEDVADRIEFIQNTSTNDNRAVSGERTENLLDNPGSNNSVYYAAAQDPDIITISMIGNNFLDNQPGGFDRPKAGFTERNKDCYDSGAGGVCAGTGETWGQMVDRIMEVLMMARQDMQEVLWNLSARTSSDIVLNTLYENEAGGYDTGIFGCETGGLCDEAPRRKQVTDMHKIGAPVLTKVLRELGWGQDRLVRIAEIAPDYHHQNSVKIEDAGGNPNFVPCVGFQDVVCCEDNTHPDDQGAQIHEQRVFEALGMAGIGNNVRAGGVESGDIGDRTTHTDVNFAYLRKVGELYPSTVLTSGGASVVNAVEAFTPGDDVAASVSINDWSSPGTFTVGGFSLPANWNVSRAQVKIRFRTSAPPVDEFYRVEASTVGFVRPALITPTNFNWFTPIVGTHGQVGATYAGGAVPVNAFPDQPTFTTASASLFPDSVSIATHPTDNRYEWYEWIPVDAADIANLEVRIQGATVAGTTPTPGEAYTVEVDGIWVEIWGTSTATAGPPGAPSQALLTETGGNLNFAWTGPTGSCDTLDYSVYQGDIGVLHSTGYNHDSALTCSTGAAPAWAQPMPAGADLYFIPVASNPSGVEGSYGQAEDGGPPVERPAATTPCSASQDLSTCG